MKITIITGPFLPLPPAPSGAVERLWKELGEEFVSRGHDVTFITKKINNPVEMPDTKSLHVAGFSRGKSLFLNLAKDYIYSSRAVRVVPESDITVVNTFWLPVLLKCKKSKVGKVVLNVARMPKGQMSLYKGIDRLAAVSSAVKNAIIKETPELQPLIKVIPNPVDVSTFKPAKSTLEGDTKRILYTGRLHPEKGLDLLLDAFKDVYENLNNVVLDIVGPYKADQGGGGQNYFKHLKEKAVGLPVEFHDPEFDKRKLVSFYHQATIFCYPSLAEKGESFGMAPLEAMASGLVPVVSKLDCFTDFIENNVTGVVFDHRVANPHLELSATIQKLLSDPEKISRISEQAIDKAATFKVEDVAGLYLDDFESLLERS